MPPKGLPKNFNVDDYAPPGEEWDVVTWYGRMPDAQPSIVVFRQMSTGKMVHHQHRLLDQVRLDSHYRSDERG